MNRSLFNRAFDWLASLLPGNPEPLCDNIRASVDPDQAMRERDWAMQVLDAHHRNEVAKAGQPEPLGVVVPFRESKRFEAAVALLPTLPAAERLRLGKPPRRGEWK